MPKEIIKGTEKNKKLVSVNSNSKKPNAISRCYGFEIGERMIEVKAISEKHALIQIVNKYWGLIDDAGEVKLMGEWVRKGI